MMTFLETVASELYRLHQHRLHRLAVVFPNRRQSIFFRYYFTQIAAAPAFVPQMLTIEELVQQSSALPVADNLLQSFELYEAYKAVCIVDGDDPEKLPDFEKFFPVGETLLKDFKEIDNYLLDISEVCAVLYNLETIEKAFEQLTDDQKSFLKQFWASITNKGQAQERFLKLWKRLPAIYSRFHEGLEQKSFTTLGMVYRRLASGHATYPAFVKAWDHVAFVGFNAFNKAEETFLQSWQQSAYASLWCDSDNYYLDDKKQEAGYFLRRNFHQLGLKSDLPPLNTINKSTNTIEVTAVQGHTAQAKIISNWLERFQGKPIDSAAILLADESLIQPVLQSLPESNTAVNVTMGYPLQHTAVFSFFNLYFSIQDDLKKNYWRSLHFEWVEEWINHPLCDWSEKDRADLSQKMMQNVLVHVPVKMLGKKSALGDLLVLRINAEEDVFSRLRQMFQLIQKQPALQEDALLQGALVAAWEVLQVAEPLFSQLKPRPSLDLVIQVLRRHLATVTIPFEGEPLRGIQVMGLLESRGLDFKNILLLGAAEGTLPRINAPQTFLPDGVRRAFGLPVPEYQDAIFAYVFYRLLHRSERMHLVYNALVSDNSTGEPSRFIQQLAFETKIPFEYCHPGTMVQPSAQPVISIKKTPLILKTLAKKYLEAETQYGFSPTQINTYLGCRLQFFFRNIASLSKPDKLTEQVEPAMLGSIVHEIMERLYEAVQKHQGNQVITTDSIGWMREQLPHFIEPAFRKEWTKDKATQPIEFIGLLEVIREVIVKYVEGFLEIDERQLPFTIENLEVPMRQPFGIELNGEVKQVFLRGYIDRVDEKDGVYRMLDYKTGGDKTEFASIEQLFERDGKKQNKAALQTLIYSWMFQKQFPEHQQFEPALVPLREINKSQGDTRLKVNKTPVTAGNINDILPEIEVRLRETLEEIFNPEVAFDQTTLLKNCEYCDYAGICQRQKKQS